MEDYWKNTLRQRVVSLVLQTIIRWGRPSIAFRKLDQKGSCLLFIVPALMIWDYPQGTANHSDVYDQWEERYERRNTGILQEKLKVW